MNELLVIVGVIVAIIGVVLLIFAPAVESNILKPILGVSAGIISLVGLMMAFPDLTSIFVAGGIAVGLLSAGIGLWKKFKIKE